MLQSWLEKRDANIDLTQEALGYGYVIYSLVNGPIAMGFIRECGPLGFIEGVTTNPDASKEDRNEAMDSLIKHLIWYAKRQNIKKVIGYTLHENLVARTEGLGFKRQPHILVSMDLGE